MNWDLYETMLSAYGLSDREASLNETKENFITSIVENPSYRDDICKNGEKCSLVIDRTETSYKYKIIALPDEELNAGDLITIDDENLIVIEVRSLNPLQKVGTAWLCNINLSFQNGTHDIITRPAVLDSGAFSTTKSGNEELQYVDKQLKLYLPYDDDTKKLFVDKRIAVDTLFDKYGQEILEVYNITGINRVARNYGHGSHLLVCDLRSDTYSPSVDNLELMICDYIADNDTSDSVTAQLPCSISGRPTIMLGQTRTYTATFYDADNQEVGGIEPIWNIFSNIEISTQEVDNTIKITVPDNEDCIGEMIQVILTDTNGLYKPFTLEVEVTA